MTTGTVRFRTRQSIEGGGDHQLQVPFRKHYVGIFPVQHLALFGDANFSVEIANGLGVDGAMRGCAAATNGAATAMKQAQIDAAFASDSVEGAMRLYISQVLVSMPPSLLESE